jgi:hypothetical protein
MKINPISVAYHRNGVCGEPFNCVIFDKIDNEGTTRMLAIRFADDEGEGFQNPRIAIFDVSLLCESNIKFGSNSFRGDHFVDAIDKIIANPTKPAYA